MEAHCRLCLSVCYRNSSDLFENQDLATKIRTCLSVEVENTTFPRHVCGQCVKKVEDLYPYYMTVLKNQILLQTHLEKGNRDLAELLKSSNHEIKKEFDQSSLENGRQNVRELSSKSNNENCSKSNGSLPQSDSRIKLEHSDTNSEDDLCLSEIKKVKKEQNEKNKKTAQRKNEVDLKKRTKAKKTNETASNIYLHKCLTCSDFKGSKPDLINHYQTKHGPSKSALILDKVIEKYTIEKLDKGALGYKCCRCGKAYDKKRNLLKHISSHEENRPFLCRLCGRTYKKAYEIFRHGRAHEGLRVQCRFDCGYSTAYVSVLGAHEKRHLGQYKYKCSECGKGFQVQTWYEEHGNIHRGLRPFKCQHCGMAFHMSRYLASHISTVHPEASNLGRHVCLHCTQPCDNRKALYKHMKDNHAITKSCLCDLCGKTLSDPEQLALHKRVHLGIKPFSCGHCPKSFTKKYNLTVHMRTHSGERAFSCAVCHRRYTQNSALRRHHCLKHGNLSTTKGPEPQENSEK